MIILQIILGNDYEEFKCNLNVIEKINIKTKSLFTEKYTLKLGKFNHNKIQFIYLARANQITIHIRTS